MIRRKPFLRHCPVAVVQHHGHTLYESVRTLREHAVPELSRETHPGSLGAPQSFNDGRRDLVLERRHVHLRPAYLRHEPRNHRVCLIWMVDCLGGDARRECLDERLNTRPPCRRRPARAHGTDGHRVMHLTGNAFPYARPLRDGVHGRQCRRYPGLLASRDEHFRDQRAAGFPLSSTQFPAPLPRAHSSPR